MKQSVRERERERERGKRENWMFCLSKSETDGGGKITKKKKDVGEGWIVARHINHRCKSHGS